MSTHHWIEIIAVLTGPLAILVLLGERAYRGRGVGARVVQLSAVVLLIPTILILALEKILDAAAVGTILGSVAGFILSKVGEYTPSKSSQGDD